MNSDFRKLAAALLLSLMVLSATPGVLATSYPVSGAYVTITGDNGYSFVITGADGTFLINNTLAAGNYTLSVYADGFLQSEVAFTINAGQTTPLGDILLGQSAAIEGTVTGAGGEPLPGIYILLRRSSDNSTVDATWTDSSGHYRFGSLMTTDTYNLWFFTSTSTGRGYMQQHLLGVSATVGQTTTGADVQLERSASISGTVMIAPSTPLEGALVRIYNAVSGSTVAMPSTDSQGKYNLSWNLPAGTYNVSILLASGAIIFDQQPIQTTVAAGQQSSGNDFTLQRSASISGRVTYPDGAPAPYTYVVAYNWDTFTSAGVSSDEDGYYSIDYDLETGDFFVYANSDMGNSADVTISTPGQSVTGVNFVVPRDGAYGWITGTVTDGLGAPMPYVGVAAEGDGYFLTYAEENGTYVMEIDMGSYDTMTFNVSSSETGYFTGFVYPVLVHNGSATSGVDIVLTMMPTGSVSGRIVSNVAPPKQDTTMTIGASTLDGQVGNPLTLTASCSVPVDAIASFMWSINGSGFGNGTSVNMNDGYATFQFTPWVPGEHQFRVSWFGDSEYNGATSDTITINVVDRPPKQNATLTIQSNTTGVSAGTAITLSGTITPSQTGQVSIHQSVNGSAFSQIGNATLSSGAWSYQTTITQPGTYAFYALWIGNDQYYSAMSQSQVSVTSTPQKTTPVVTISVSKASVALNSTHTSEAVTITGTMTPFAQGITINVRVTSPGGQVTNIPVTPTSSPFSATVTINSAGSWTIQVQVPEGVEFNAASSNTVSVSATTTAAGDNTMLYVGGGIAGVAIVAVVAIFLMKKKAA